MDLPTDSSALIVSFLSGLAIAILLVVFMAYFIIAPVNEYERESLIDGKNDLAGEEFPVDVGELESSEWEGTNTYILSHESNELLNENAFVLIPEGREAEAEKSVPLPDSDEISIVSRAINGALLVENPAYWISRDCGKSIFKMKIKGYKNGLGTPVVKEKEVSLNNKEKRIEFDVSEFKGGKIDVYLKSKEPHDSFCRSSNKKNEAVFIRELFVKHKDGLMPN